MKKTIILLTLLCLLLASCGEQAKPAESSAPEEESSETVSESLGQEEELLALQAELKEANQDLVKANRRLPASGGDPFGGKSGRLPTVFDP